MIRGILTALAGGAVRLFSASGRPGETFDQREFIQHYGFRSAPKAGAELVLIVRGNVITAIADNDRRYTIDLADGEVALHDWQGQKVHLKADGLIEVVAIDKITATAPEVEVVASTKVTMTTPLLEVTGSITAGGDITDATRSMAADRQIYNGHTHAGVQGGPSSTAPPTQTE